MTIPTFRRAAVPGGGALRHELIDGADKSKVVQPPADVGAAGIQEVTDPVPAEVIAAMVQEVIDPVSDAAPDPVPPPTGGESARRTTRSRTASKE